MIQPFTIEPASTYIHRHIRRDNVYKFIKFDFVNDFIPLFPIFFSFKYNFFRLCILLVIKDCTPAPDILHETTYLYN